MLFYIINGRKMKKENVLLIIVPLVLLLLWLFSGFYFGVYRASLAVASCEIEKSLIPASPIVTSSYYDIKNKELVLQIENPSGMPIMLLTKSLVLKPADKDVPVSNLIIEVPLNIDLPPYETITIRLKVDTPDQLKLWDVLLTTLTYRLPISRDIYSVLHLFKHSGNIKDWQVQNEYGNNQTLRQKYNKENSNTNK